MENPLPGKMKIRFYKSPVPWYEPKKVKIICRRNICNFNKKYYLKIISKIYREIIKLNNIEEVINYLEKTNPSILIYLLPQSAYLINVAKTHLDCYTIVKNKPKKDKLAIYLFNCQQNILIQQI